jgi:hypothetical protein
VANARNYRNEGFIDCDGSATVYPLSGAKFTTALGLADGVSTSINAKDDFGGYNQVTVGVTGLTGGKTWKIEAAVGSAWFELDAGLATDVTLVTHGVGPQVGVHESATPSFRQLPSFRASAYRVTLSAADNAGKIHVIAESFPQ